MQYRKQAIFKLQIYAFLLTLIEDRDNVIAQIFRQPVTTGRSLQNKTIYSSFNKNPFINSSSECAGNTSHLENYLLSLLKSLEFVEQSPCYHPEGNALFHSLQVYQCAQVETDDAELLAAALLHDVGKAIDYPNHDKVGAEALQGLLSPRAVWLVEHHLDLLVSPQKTRRRLAGTKRLVDLEKLRRWDLRGRDPHATVVTPEQALDSLFVFSS